MRNGDAIAQRGVAEEGVVEEEALQSVAFILIVGIILIVKRIVIHDCIGHEFHEIFAAPCASGDALSVLGVETGVARVAPPHDALDGGPQRACRLAESCVECIKGIIWAI